MRSKSGDSDNVPAKLHEELGDVVPQEVVILCVGSTMRGDDGFGPAVAEALHGAAARLTARVFDGGQTPENELPRIARLAPAVVVLVDAVDFAAAPGTLRLLNPEQLRQDGFDTHTASLSLTVEFLKESCGARVLLLAAQPGDVSFGKPLSGRLRAAARRAAVALLEAVGGGR